MDGGLCYDRIQIPQSSDKLQRGIIQYACDMASELYDTEKEQLGKSQ